MEERIYPFPNSKISGNASASKIYGLTMFNANSKAGATRSPASEAVVARSVVNDDVILERCYPKWSIGSISFFVCRSIFF